MVTDVRRPVRPTTPADVHRLAAQGEAKGVQLFQVQATGAWFATSVSHPGELHALTGYSCDCCGFVHHGRCMHHSLLLARLGWLPESKSMDLTPGSVVCPACRGAGQCYVETHGGAGWPDQVPCYRCHGADRLPVTIRTLARPGTLAADR